MKLLLDTPALLWWLSDDARLGPRARGLVAEPGNDVLVSVVSIWEILVKIRVGKLEADLGDIAVACERQGFLSVPITPEHLRRLSTLPVLHPDPFDHLLIAQAITEDATFVTGNRVAERYPVQVVGCGG
ncbi:type II toxin-antitoxin system VapC family toxin [Rhodopila globiformis]|uniref:PIN domain nuclease n=1 Tax=Rhodopila globiformis TaxID=1071 RepID=A0A2S6MYW9_RHOGL|nr:type II toxin-antitoxin system VapC family toxin [Rhodopila globiformis]PPQ27563.1 PIN domain nuclease [Rhodopila globiformis]